MESRPIPLRQIIQFPLDYLGAFGHIKLGIALSQYGKLDRSSVLNFPFHPGGWLQWALWTNRYGVRHLCRQSLATLARLHSARFRVCFPLQHAISHPLVAQNSGKLSPWLIISQQAHRWCERTACPNLQCPLNLWLTLHTRPVNLLITCSG